jgi:hypothetical protein
LVNPRQAAPARRSGPSIAFYQSAAMPGYGEAFTLLDTVVRLLSENALRAVPAGADPVEVTEIKPVEDA